MNKARKIWKHFWRRERHSRAARLDMSTIGQRGRLAAVVADRQRGGEVSFNVDSTDCDHCRVQYADNMPAVPLRAIEARIEAEYEGAEGATHVWIDTPENGIGYSFRDLVMEAHEDGHPHVVYG